MKIFQHLATLIMVVCMAWVFSPSNANANGLSDALGDWDPGIIQGTVMEVGSNYIVVNEKMIYLIDASHSGKNIKTSIKEAKGPNIGRDVLRKGDLVLAKGSIGIDDRSKGEVLFATEVYRIPHVLGPGDAEEYKGLLDPPAPLK